MRILGVVVLLFCTAAGWGQFDLQDSGTAANLRGIDALGAGVAWASGSDGTVIRTVNGGHHWQRCAVPVGGEKLDFRAVQAFDAKTALVMSSGTGALSRVYKTIDGCRTWTLVMTNESPDGFWDSLKMWNREAGFLVGDAVDGKLTILERLPGPDDDLWESYAYLSSFTAVQGKGESAFAASNSCLALSEYRDAPGTTWTMWFATGGSNGSYVRRLEHTNGGEPETFTTLVAPVPGFPRTESAGIFSISFIDDCRGVVVGGDYLKPDQEAGTAAWSGDGGKSWTQALHPPHGYRSAVASNLNGKVWLAVGPNGADISRDGGKDWTALQGDTAAGWNAISLPFVVGPKGRVGRVVEGVLSGR